MVLRLALSVISLVVSPLSPKRAHNRDKDNVFFLNSCFLFKKNQSTLKIIPQTSHFVNSSWPIGRVLPPRVCSFTLSALSHHASSLSGLWWDSGVSSLINTYLWEFVDKVTWMHVELNGFDGNKYDFERGLWGNVRIFAAKLGNCAFDNLIN